MMTAPKDTCMHCEQPIMKLQLKEGEQWWHMPQRFPKNPVDNIVRRNCVGRITEAEPRE